MKMNMVMAMIAYRKNYMTVAGEMCRKAMLLRVLSTGQLSLMKLNTLALTDEPINMSGLS
jgi:hypothetical protein